MKVLRIRVCIIQRAENGKNNATRKNQSGKAKFIVHQKGYNRLKEITATVQLMLQN